MLPETCSFVIWDNVTVPVIATPAGAVTWQEPSVAAINAEAVGVGSPCTTTPAPTEYVPAEIASGVPCLTLITTSIEFALFDFAATLAQAPGLDETSTCRSVTGKLGAPTGDSVSVSTAEYASMAVNTVAPPAAATWVAEVAPHAQHRMSRAGVRVIILGITASTTPS